MSQIKFDDIGMYLDFVVILNENLLDDERESELNCSKKIKQLEDIVEYIELYKKQDYSTLFKGHLDDYEFDMIEDVIITGITHEGKNKKDKSSIRIQSCRGGKHTGVVLY